MERADDPEKFRARAQKNNYKNGTIYNGLKSQIIYGGLLPTPNCMDALPPKQGEAMEKMAKGHRKGRTAPSNLREYVNPPSWVPYMNTMLPTPIAGDYKGQRRKDGTASMLSGKASLGLLPTPTTRDHKGGNSMEHLTRPSGHANHANQLPNFIKIQTGSTSQLNPRFVAEMMGYPENYTELPFLTGETKA